MKIEIIPATDIIGGACVRLTQGDYGRRTTYYSDPLEAALRFEETGIRRLHMVDLDGAKAAQPRNLAVLERIASKTALEVQYGGGIKSTEALRSVFDAGARRAICGSVAVRRPELFRRMARGIRAGKADSRSRHTRRQSSRSGLDGSVRTLGSGADRAVRAAGTLAGNLHRHRPRRHALRRIGGVFTPHFRAIFPAWRSP